MDQVQRKKCPLVVIYKDEEGAAQGAVREQLRRYNESGVPAVAYDKTDISQFGRVRKDALLEMLEDKRVKHSGDSAFRNDMREIKDDLRNERRRLVGRERQSEPYAMTD